MLNTPENLNLRANLAFHRALTLTLDNSFTAATITLQHNGKKTVILPWKRVVRLMAPTVGTAESNQVLLVTSLTSYSQEPMLQSATFQEFTKFFFYMEG